MRGEMAGRLRTDDRRAVARARADGKRRVYSAACGVRLSAASKHATQSRCSRAFSKTHTVSLFVRNAQVQVVEPPALVTTAGAFRATRIVVCPGNDTLTLFPQSLAAHRIKNCKLQMMRLAPQPSGWRLPCAVMGDLSLVRYGGFASCAAAKPLHARLHVNPPTASLRGFTCCWCKAPTARSSSAIRTTYADTTPDPFAPAAIERMILDEALRLIDVPDPRVIERWTGVYPSARNAGHHRGAPPRRARGGDRERHRHEHRVCGRRRSHGHTAITRGGDDRATARKMTPARCVHAACRIPTEQQWLHKPKSPTWRCSAISRTSRSASPTPSTRNSTSTRCSNACCSKAASSSRKPIATGTATRASRPRCTKRRSS